MAGRPKGKKSKIVPVRLKETDLTFFKQLAEEKDLPLATYIRFLIYKGLKLEESGINKNKIFI